MLRASAIIRKPNIGTRIVVDSITLERQSRYRRRVLLQTDGGLELMLDLSEATYMAGGDALDVGDDRCVRIVAAPESLLEIHAHGVTELARIAWHIGNRHTPAEITPTAIYIQPDHVLQEMVQGLGAHVHHVTRPFEPEGGAYGGKGPLLGSHHGHSHAEGHDHTHDHHHGHDHD